MSEERKCGRESGRLKSSELLKGRNEGERKQTSKLVNKGNKEVGKKAENK